jgi:alkanesulfonate monooxygenase SsuD/methylene tetrahydromethanopterin reductase-like flavin-dependent oxidoreductase (luciferase family)
MSDEAANIAFPPYVDVMGRIGRERGWPPPTRRQFDAERSRDGALLIGSPQELVDKILYEHELFANQRFLIQLTVGPTPHDKVMRAIELLGTRVAPVVRQAVGEKREAPLGTRL